MPEYIIPTTAALMQIEQDLRPRLEADRPVFEIIPTRSVDEWFVEWEQKDNYTGLQHLRGLDGPPTRVMKVGAKRFLYRPGVYGEYIHLNEQELTVPQRRLGSWDGRLDLSGIVAGHQEYLLQRELDRIESTIWTLLTTGTFMISENGVTHSDTFDLTTYDASDWSVLTTGSPIADLRAVKLLQRGHSVSLGAASPLWMNQVTANQLLQNRNPNDLGGQLTVSMAGIQPLVRNLATINDFLVGQDLPQIRIYDGGYLDDSGVFTVYIPNGKAVLVGQRAGGAQLGEWRFVINANNPNNAAGPYTRVIDQGEDRVPRTVEVHKGMSGGPVLWYPGAIVVMTVGA